jgi:DNA-binding PadR family transcriptional regulator
MTLLAILTTVGFAVVAVAGFGLDRHLRRVERNLVELTIRSVEPCRVSWVAVELAHHTGIRSQSIYPVLAALERDGVIESDWEPWPGGRIRRRRVYRCRPEWAIGPAEPQTL